jgi:hypothetical protein
MSDGDRNFECPLCGLEFLGAVCRTSCVFASGCGMVRCPACGYEFVESGMIVRFLRRIHLIGEERV